MAVTMSSKPVAAGLAATDAGFRSLGQAVTDALEAVGFVAVYDTINWSTATMPASTGVYYSGKRVYRFNDSNSSTQEVYFSVELGRGDTGTAAIGFRIRFVVGTTHSSGTVGGHVQTHYIGIGSTATNEGEVVAVRTDAGFTLFSNIPFTGSWNGQWVFCAERLRHNGEVTADGVVTFTHGVGADTSGTSGQPSLQASNFALATVYGAYSALWTTVPAVVAPTANILIDYQCPVFPIYTFGKYDPFLGVVITTRSTPDLSVFSATVGGVSHTYRSSSFNAGLDTYNNGGHIRPSFLVA